MVIPFDRLANLDQIAGVQEYLSDCGDGRNWRVIEITPYRGIHLKILPASFNGIPLNWVGHAGENGPTPELKGWEWEDKFAGGLLTTCGLSNVGAPSEECGLHGVINHLSADKIKIDRSICDGEVVIKISATLFEKTLEGGLFQFDRIFEVRTGKGELRIYDNTKNLSNIRLPAPILYHFNFGWPVIDINTKIEINNHNGIRVVEGRIEDSPFDWAEPWLDMADVSPITVEHLLCSHALKGNVTILARNVGLAIEICWSKKNLPRLNQWINTGLGRGVVAIEPSNCSTLGKAHDREEGRLIFIEARKNRRTFLKIDVSEIPKLNSQTNRI